MEQELLSWFTSDQGMVTHVTIFTLLVLGGFGLPIPEDIPVISGGVALAQNVVQFPEILITCYIGVITADQVVFCLGYFFGNRLLDAGKKSRFFPSITEERVNEIREGLRRKRFIYIFIGRHLFPLRTATFITAGALRIPFVDFLVADLVAALISVPIILFIGYYVGQRLTQDVISHFAHQFQWYLTGFVLLCFGIYFARKRCRKSNVPKKC